MMKFTATIVVEIGALICVFGVLLMRTIELSPHEVAFLRALVGIIVGLFFIQIGYAQSLREKTAEKPERRPDPRSDNPE